MADQAPTLTRHDLEAKIVKRCWEDEAFHKEFIGDPASAFVRYLEVPATSLPKVVIHEESAGSWHIVLPQRPPKADELSEQDLERVAGGIHPSAIWSATVGVSASGGALVVVAAASATLQKGW
jgi:hypothetical protein